MKIYPLKIKLAVVWIGVGIVGVLLLVSVAIAVLPRLGPDVTATSALLATHPVLAETLSSASPAPSSTPLNTPTPDPARLISSQTVDYVTEVARFGKGDAGQVAWSPDGRMLAVVSSIGVYLYDSTTLGQPQFLESDVYVISVTFSPDGKLLAAGGAEGTIKLWDMASGQEILTLHRDTPQLIEHVTFSPDGKLLAAWESTSERFELVGRVTVWDVTTGQEISAISKAGRIVQLAFSAAGQAATVDEYGAVKLWDIANGWRARKLSSYSGSSFQPTALLSPDGILIAIVDTEGVALLDAASGRTVRVLDDDKLVENIKAFSPDGTLLAAVEEGSTLALWDVTSGQKVREIFIDCAMQSAVFSPDWKLLAVWSNQYDTLMLWDIASDQQARALNWYRGAGGSVAFSPDAKFLVDGYSLRLWDISASLNASGMGGREVRAFDGAGMHAVAFSPDGTLLATGGGLYTKDGRTKSLVKLWGVASGQEMMTLSGRGYWVSSVVFSPDGMVLATAEDVSVPDDGVMVQITLWDMASGREVRTIDINHGTVTSVAFSPDGTLIAAGGNGIKLWNAASGEAVREIDTAGIVTSIAFSPDGMLLAAGGGEGVAVWEVASNEPAPKFVGRGEYVYAVTFSPDGTLLVTGNIDHTLMLWDVASGQARTLSGHTRRVSSVAFSPDGRWLASGSDDGTVRLWGVAQP